MNHITLSALDYATPPSPPKTSPWAFCVICWDLNLLLLFNKSTAIKIGLQLCFRLPNNIRPWNIFWHFVFFFLVVGFLLRLIPSSLWHVVTRQAGMISNFFPLPKTHPYSPAGQPICGAPDIRINLLIQHPVSMLCSFTSAFSMTDNNQRKNMLKCQCCLLEPWNVHTNSLTPKQPSTL